MPRGRHNRQHGGRVQTRGYGGGGGDDGTYERRPQTTAKAGSFLESTAKYRTLMYTQSGLSFSTPTISQPLKAVPGYISRLIVTITASGGAAGTGTTVAAATDAPWSLIQTIRVLDASGYPVYFSDGFGARLINLYGGQQGPGTFRDPQQWPSFSNVATGAGSSGNFTFSFAIPFELGAGYGCIAGSSQSRVPSLVINLGGSSAVYTTAPGTLPTLAIRVTADFYGAPLDDPSRRPPGYGSSVQWGFAPAANTVATGGQYDLIVPAPNLTGFIGNIIMCSRNTSLAREDGVWNGSTDIEAWVDQEPRYVETFTEFQDRHAAQYEIGLAAPTGNIARPTGTAAYTFRDSVYPYGPTGLDNLALWSPSDTGSLYEFKGVAGTISSGPDTVTMYTQRLYPEGAIPVGPEFD